MFIIIIIIIIIISYVVTVAISDDATPALVHPAVSSALKLSAQNGNRNKTETKQQFVSFPPTADEIVIFQFRFSTSHIF